MLQIFLRIVDVSKIAVHTQKQCQGTAELKRYSENENEQLISKADGTSYLHWFSSERVHQMEKLEHQDCRSRSHNKRTLHS